VARLPEEASTLLAICKDEGLSIADLSNLVALLQRRCARLAAHYGSEIMGTTQGVLL
jgi:hypothetical protein